MSEPEKFLQNFLERWSRRKLAATETAAGEAPNAESSETENTAANTPADAASDAAAVAFDRASLPPIESVTAASDIRAFLAPGVPLVLTRAALRRAWASDPTIRDFIGLAENQWDFTRPEGVPGFGPLEPSPDLRRVLATLYDDIAAEGARAPDADSADTSETSENSGETASPDRAAGSLADTAAQCPVSDPEILRQPGDNNAAMQDDPVGDAADQAPAHRKHGRALPK
jgi:hypothetical protein